MGTSIPGNQKGYFPAMEINDYLKNYLNALNEKIQFVSKEELQKATDLILEIGRVGSTVFVAGNGGSFAISQHLCCDWVKGTMVESIPPIKVHTLGTNLSFLTAVSNDFSYEESFSLELDVMANSGDVLVLISSSGNSPNIVKALEVGKKKGMKVIGFSGFDGGKLNQMADVKLHVPIHNYGVVEDCHQLLMHVMAQFIYLSRK